MKGWTLDSLQAKNVKFTVMGGADVAVLDRPKAAPKSAMKPLPEPTPQDLVAMAAKGWPAEKRICVELPTPPGLNNAYKNTGGNGRTKSDKLKKFYADATAALATYGKRLDAETYRATILVTRESKLSDIDGKAKFALDVLVKCGIIPDDRYCERVTIEWRYLHEPGTTVVLDRYRKRRVA